MEIHMRTKRVDPFMHMWSMLDVVKITIEKQVHRVSRTWSIPGKIPSRNHPSPDVQWGRNPSL